MTPAIERKGVVVVEMAAMIAFGVLVVINPMIGLAGLAFLILCLGAVAKPRATFVALVFGRFLSDYLTDPTVSSGSTSTIAITGATAVFAAIVALSNVGRLGRLPARDYAAFAAFVGWVALRSLTSASAGQGLRETIQWGSYLLSFAIAGILFGTSEGVRTIARVVVIGGIAQSVLATIQLATGNVATYLTVSDTYTRPTGTFPHTTWLAFYLAICLMATALTGWRPRQQVLAIAGITVGLGLTFSRGAMIFVLVGTLVYAAYTRRARIVGLAIAGAVVAASVPAIRNRFTGEYNSGRLQGSYESRGLLRNYAFELWLQKPLIGHGSGSFFATYSPMRFNEPIEAHSDVFKLLADQGLVGLGLYLVVAATIVTTILRSHVRELYPVAAIVTTLPIMGVLDVYYRVNTAEVVLWSLAGAATVAAYRSRRPQGPQRRSPSDQAGGDEQVNMRGSRACSPGPPVAG